MITEMNKRIKLESTSRVHNASLEDVPALEMVDAVLEAEHDDVFVLRTQICPKIFDFGIRSRLQIVHHIKDWLQTIDIFAKINRY